MQGPRVGAIVRPALALALGLGLGLGLALALALAATIAPALGLAPALALAFALTSHFQQFRDPLWCFRPRQPSPNALRRAAAAARRR